VLLSDLRNKVRQNGCFDLFPTPPPINYKKDFVGLRTVTWEILKYTWNFEKEKRARIEELRKKYPQTDFVIFNNQKDANIFLQSMNQ
jgi:hypothetical protein